MVTSECELSPKEIHVIFSDAKDDGKAFLLDLAVVSFDEFNDLEA